MKKYIGVKIVEAEPMNKYEFFISHKGEECKEDNEEGYMVKYPDGYESWCPKKQFEEANKSCDGMTFGHAIEALKKGLMVARKGWNGKGMFLWLMKEADVKREWLKEPGIIAACGDNDTIHCLGSIRMKTAQGSILTGWLASQSDILADDWEVCATTVGAEESKPFMQRH